MHEFRIFSTGVRRLFEFAGKEGGGGGLRHILQIVDSRKLNFARGGGLDPLNPL